MNETTNYKLKKPAQNDYYNVEDFNENADIIDAVLQDLANHKADLDDGGKISADQLPDDLPTAEDKGQPGGLATLDENGKIPSDQLPDNIPTAEDKGQPGGLATLDESGKIPSDQLPDISSSSAQTVTLTTSGWTEGTDGRYYQTVSVSGVTADTPVVLVDCALDGTDLDADAEVLEAWQGPSANNVKQGDGTLTFYSYEIPSVNIPVNVGVA